MLRRYDEHHREALFAQLHLPVTERTCPICGHVGLRDYHHEKYGRIDPSWINYLWCGNCHAYSSSFTNARREMVKNDPLLAEYGDRISEVFNDPERLLKILDGYWKSGRLPQVISRRPRRR
ncbi:MULTISPECIES: hypothetical protein [unclassified Streptomyces]|uniref:hypothetical protein n=1 Tax=unclassified Streptomyces TaxID=2593676 RepID=UPI002DDA2E44|nr:hypothetical protein [Streptomyces sp. NBC_00151]WRZ38108.1 hypothetical protein OG915_08620 [Streptomyces sp. NBC_00151]